MWRTRQPEGMQVTVNRKSVAEEAELDDCAPDDEVFSVGPEMDSGQTSEEMHQDLHGIQVPNLADELPMLTVIVPVFNEAPTVGDLLRRVTMVPLDKQVIVVDDGSTDATAEVLDRWESEGVVEVLRHDRNRGKGAAIRTGLEHAQGHFTIIQDGDLEYDPLDFPRILEPLLFGEVEVVYGSRYLDRGNRQRTRWSVLRWGVALLNVCVRLLYGRRVTDEATCYKALPTAVLRAMDLQCERFEFCPEVTAKACRMGLRIAEVPIRYAPRTRAEGKKIRMRDGWAAMRELWRWRHWQPNASTWRDHYRTMASTQSLASNTRRQ